MNAENFKVYKHTTPSGKVYIGITKQDVKQRWRDGNGYKTQTLFYRAIEKYGWENINHEILFENLTQEQANQKEIELIRQYRSNDAAFGYNIDNGGNAVGTFSEEHIRKMILAQNNPALTERKRQASVGEKNWFYGKTHTEEARRKMSEAKKGKPSNAKGKRFSDEARKNISEAHKGKPSPMKGKHFSEQARQNIKDAHQGKKILCVETNVIYSSFLEASKQTGISNANICQCCKGKRKTAGGYVWRYVAEAG